MISVVHKAKEYNSNYRMGAYLIAIDRVINAMKLRGWI
jgi:glutamate dehydrogenase/leucine dehydrogenase